MVEKQILILVFRVITKQSCKLSSFGPHHAKTVTSDLRDAFSWLFCEEIFHYIVRGSLLRLSVVIGITVQVCSLM